jgi:2Fe-2S ferredoxin
VPKITVITLDGTLNIIEAAVGQSLMEAIRGAGIVDLLALCGGTCSCGTCHVYVRPECVGMLQSASQEETDLVDAGSHVLVASRLSCQIPVTEALEGLIVTVAPHE